METAFLSSGEKVFVHEKTKTWFIVENIQIYEPYDESEPEEYGSGIKYLTGNIYKSAPKSVYESEFKELVDKVENYREEVLRLSIERKKVEHEISQLSKTKTDREKFIIDLSEFSKANRLSFFVKGQIAPVTDERPNDNYWGSMFKGTKINLYVSVFDGKQKAWGYKIYDEQRNWDFNIEENGILIDKTEDEIIELARKRCDENEFNDQEVYRTEDKWLSDKLINRKIKISQLKREESERNRLEEIEALKQKIQKLMDQEI